MEKLGAIQVNHAIKTHLILYYSGKGRSVLHGIRSSCPIKGKCGLHLSLYWRGMSWLTMTLVFFAKKLNWCNSFIKYDTWKSRSHQCLHPHAYVHIMAGIKEVDMTCIYFWVAHKTSPLLFFLIFTSTNYVLSCGILFDFNLVTVFIWWYTLITRICGQEFISYWVLLIFLP